MGEDDDGPPGRDDRLPTKPAAVVGVTLPPLRWWRSGGGVGPRTLPEWSLLLLLLLLLLPEVGVELADRGRGRGTGDDADAPSAPPPPPPLSLSLLPAPVDSSPRAVDKEPLEAPAADGRDGVREDDRGKRCRDDDRCGDRCGDCDDADDADDGPPPLRCLFSLTNLVAPG